MMWPWVLPSWSSTAMTMNLDQWCPHFDLLKFACSFHRAAAAARLGGVCAGTCARELRESLAAISCWLIWGHKLLARVTGIDIWFQGGRLALIQVKANCRMVPPLIEIPSLLRPREITHQTATDLPYRALFKVDGITAKGRDFRRFFNPSFNPWCLCNMKGKWHYCYSGTAKTVAWIKTMQRSKHDMNWPLCWTWMQQSKCHLCISSVSLYVLYSFYTLVHPCICAQAKVSNVQSSNLRSPQCPIAKVRHQAGTRTGH